MLNKQLADNSLDDIPTNYFGSKKRILPWMGEILIKHKIIQDDTYFLDVFGGSGIVSYYLSKLGLSGTVNDLLVSSHLNHVAMFSNTNPAFTKENFIVPPNVYFKEYIFEDINKDIKKKDDDDGFFDDLESDEKVAVDVKFTSKNSVFNEIYKMISKYNLIFFTSREIFEMCCAITNFIMFENLSINNSNAKVSCCNYDAYTFLENITINNDNYFVYIDPPYGGANSKYHKMYSVLECIAYMAWEIKKIFDINLQELLENIDKDETRTRIYVSEASNYKYKNGDWPSEVEDLPHIQKYGWRFNTTNAFDYKLSFEKMMNIIYKKGIKRFVFSFNSDSSWMNEEEFVSFMKEKYNVEIIVEKIPINYSPRKVNKGSLNVDMSKITVGSSDAEDITGKRTETSEEIVYICKRRD